MVSRIQFDGVHEISTQTNSSMARAELMMSPVPTGAELPEHAVAPPSNVHELFSPHDERLRHTAAALGEIKDQSDNAREAEQRAQQLEQLLQKMLLGYKALTAGTDIQDSPAIIGQASSAADDVIAMSDQGVSVPSQKPKVADLVLKTTAGSSSVGSQSGSSVDPVSRRHEQALILQKIENAIDRVATIQGKLEKTRTDSYAQIYLSTSLGGLNSARSQVASSGLSGVSASQIYDMVMQNVATAVFSHGKVSADVVRLALA